MAFQPGTHLGPYEIHSPLGAGGMGEVYRATDTKLKRQVAIKILPPSLAADPDRLARFQREAEVLASLNHPHIAAIYGLEEAVGAKALVMELVEGEDLSQRIARGPIPIDEALPIARQIADALEAAHEHGIIHRDLKPANMKVRPDGMVKVLDFGLAKAMEPADAMLASASMSPTITSPAMMTGAGIILGTAAYMSPEQARGKPLDKRADIWAFGCVLYEMLAARRAFEGDGVSDTLAAVLRGEPDWSALPASTPASIRRLLRRCLEKDVRKRWQAAGDLRIEIEAVLVDPRGIDLQQSPVTSVGTRGSRERLAWTAAAFCFGATLALGAVMYVYRRSAPSEAPEVRLQIVTPPGDLISLAISPDGRKVVFQATTEGQTQLWLRLLESETAQPLAGTEGATNPFWSPDSQSVGFIAGQGEVGLLKRIDLASGAVRTVAPRAARGSAWNAEGILVFSTFQTAPLSRVSAEGGAVEEVTRLDPPRQTSHRRPSFLPDGRHFLFFALGTPEGRGVYLGSLDSTDTRRLFEADSAAVFAPPDSVLFARQGVLMAQRLNLDTLELIGDPAPVASRVATAPGNVGSVALSASAAGPVAYRAGAEERRLVWRDRSGLEVGTIGEPDRAQPGFMRLSPDASAVALNRTVSGNTDLWVVEAARGALRPVSSDPAGEFNPIWSSDGSRLVFSSNRQGVLDLYEKQVNGGGTETELLASGEQKNSFDWSPDDRFILYAVQTSSAGRDLWVLPLFGNRTSLAVARTAFEETNGRFSPDGRWIAYQSNDSRRNEVYVQAFPGPGRRLTISTSGGAIPQWRNDGRELFYMGPNNRVMAVPITLNNSTVEAGTPVALFTTPRGSEYAASPNGQRFLINEVTKEADPITVLLNWPARLKK